MYPLLLTFILLISTPWVHAEEWTPADDSLPPLAAEQGHIVTDAEILRAHQAWKTHDQTQLDILAAQVNGPLSDYPRYWSLEGHLERGDIYLVPDLQLFFHRYPNSPLTPLLRHQWLNWLGKTQNWQTFETQFTSADSHNDTLQCYHWQARFATGNQDFFDDALHYWKTHATWPSSCDIPFRQLFAAHRLTTTDLWTAMRHALAHNRLRQARYINSFFPPFQGINEDHLSLAEERPQQFLDDNPILDASTRPAQRELWLYALQRLANHHPEDAINIWNDIAPRLSAEDRNFGWQQLALQSAMNLDPKAFEWFQQASSPTGNDEWITWKIRSALRQQEWASVLDGVAQLSPSESRKPVWLYWKSQALIAEQRPQEAAILLDRLVDDPSYYGLLSREERHLPLTLPLPDKQPDGNPQKYLTTLLERPLRLYQLGLIPEAQREWKFIEPNLTAVQHWQAAQLAYHLNWYDRSIHSAEHATGLMDATLLFPTPYEASVNYSAHLFNLDSSWLYAIIRQESRFFAEAKSQTGAQGLTQLMPATARWAAKRLHLTPLHHEDITQPDTNILLGSYYFSHLQQLLGNPILATIGYNAGPLRAQRWATQPFPDARIFIENIPFDETRDYVEQVSYNQVMYQKRLHPESSPHLYDLLNSLSLPHP
ncbi:MAG: transglycosylase SLT domain-containing protein [Betaproteobacteria bacterium]|nr:transglycosylase SLT domain-containing protein [Betaproteobacteria bacterium]